MRQFLIILGIQQYVNIVSRRIQDMMQNYSPEVSPGVGESLVSFQ